MRRHASKYYGGPKLFAPVDVNCNFSPFNSGERVYLEGLYVRGGLCRGKGEGFEARWVHHVAVVCGFEHHQETSVSMQSRA